MTEKEKDTADFIIAALNTIEPKVEEVKTLFSKKIVAYHVASIHGEQRRKLISRLTNILLNEENQAEQLKIGFGRSS